MVFVLLAGRKFVYSKGDILAWSQINDLPVMLFDT
jgi:hypothetical protein